MKKKEEKEKEKEGHVMKKLCFLVQDVQEYIQLVFFLCFLWNFVMYPLCGSIIQKGN
jgi:hypothetical protein